MISSISIKTKFGWISAFEEKGKIIRVKFGKHKSKSINKNLAKFIRNVESRIYSQISKNLVDKMFGEEASDTGEVTIDGNNISYSKTNTSITMTIVDSNGSTTTMTIPIGEFTF